MELTARTLIAAAAAGAALSAGWAAAGAEESACASLAGLDLDNTRIDIAEDIVPDPVWPFPPSLINAFAGPDAGVKSPFCRVAGIIEEEIGFEVWLPEDWNGKLHSIGNGGMMGAFVYPQTGAALEAGYAAATTDMGHKVENPLDTDWAAGRPDRVENFGHRAHHLLAVAAKQILAAYYGRKEDYAYFVGCSSGGWQGLTEAQKYPHDYDGIVAGAPANNMVRRQGTGYWVRAMTPEGGALSRAKGALVAKAAVARCDGEDGVEDGIIGKPEQCGFDPAELQCAAGEAGEDCLTPAEVETARLMHGRRTSPGGLKLYPGPAYGVSVGAPTTSIPGSTQTQAPLIRLVETEHEWSPDSFDPDRDIPALEAEMGDMLAATNPDLSAFAEAGGKLILWHGWLDFALSPYNTIDYYASVVETMRADTVADFARLYMLPGVSHCAGGSGPDMFDPLAALERWVEAGEAPVEIIAAKRGPGGKPAMTRPLCPYPLVAEYDGAGDPNEAASFSCAGP
jgi:feruloyl esterase